MYWFLAKLCILVCAPLPIGARITRPDPTKNGWVFSCLEWKPAWRLVRDLYLEQKDAYKSE